MQLRNRNVWLIGASSGIGEAMVPRLVEAGARLAISSRRAAVLGEVAAREQSGGPPIVTLPVDVTVPGDLKRASGELLSHWGRIDVMIYNAGAWSAVDVDTFDAEECERQVAVNLTGMMRAVEAVLPGMLQRGSGDIVGVASVSGYGALPRAEAYGASKAAAIYFLRSLYIDLRKRGVGVTTVNPGFVETPLTEHNDFPMPFMIQADEAAERIIAGLLKGEREVHFPRRLSIGFKLLTALPGPLYEWLVSRTLAR
jgi:short-subunit dehydrogenase